MSTEPHPDDQQRSTAGAADSLRSSLHDVADSGGAAKFLAVRRENE